MRFVSWFAVVVLTADSHSAPRALSPDSAAGGVATRSGRPHPTALQWGLLPAIALAALTVWRSHGP
jgi:hypothetical protein